jgi:hypothetical protein
MKATELERFLEPTISQAGFKLSAIEDPTIYQSRPAWVIYYLGDDCKLQICWSARDGGIDYLLAPLDAPNEFGLLNESKKGRLMLMLSRARDNLVTPGVDADDQVEMTWLQALFAIHIDSARAELAAGA